MTAEQLLEHPDEFPLATGVYKKLEDITLRKKLEDADIRDVELPDQRKRLVLKDTIVSGLSVRITSTGNKVFSVRIKLHGRDLRYTLGRYKEDLTLKEARDKARDAKSLSRKGIDPRTDPGINGKTPGSAFHKPGSAEPSLISHENAEPVISPPHATLTFDVAIDKFLAAHCARENKPSTAAETRRLLKSYFKAWTDRPLATITKGEISDRLDDIIDGGAPSGARHAYTALRTFFAWSTARDYIATNPVLGIAKPKKGEDRDRTLTKAELQALCKTARALGYPYGTYLEILLITGQRRNEVAGIRRSEIDYNENLWKIPRKRSKNKQANYIPLTPRLRAILKSMPATGTDLYFPSETSPDRSFSHFSKIKRKFDSRCGFTDWTIHDIRRSVATNMGFLGVPQPIIDRVLNHKKLKGSAAVYQLYEYLADKDDALRAWQAHLKKIARGALETKTVRRRRQYPTVAAH